MRLTIECELGSDWEMFSALFALLEFEVFFDGGRPNHHVVGGNHRLIEALATHIRGDKTLGAMVTGISRTTDASGSIHVRVAYLKDNKVNVAEGRRVVVAVPFVRVHQLDIEPPLPAEYWTAIDTLGMGQYVVVHFLMDRAGFAPMLIGEDSPFPILSNGPLGVIYGINEMSPKTQPLEVFTLLIYGWPARAFHMMPRDQKLREVLGEMDALWPHFSNSVKSTDADHSAAIPVWPVGRSPLDDKMELVRKPVLGLHLAGDYLYNAHSDGAARAGLHVAEAIAAELHAPR